MSRPKTPKAPAEKVLSSESNLSEKQKLLFQLDALKAETTTREDAYRKADAELRASKVEAEKIEQRLAVLRDDAFLKALTPELIDALAPDHSRTSCSDKDHCNSDRGCPRCSLLEAKRMGYIDFQWSFEIKPTNY